MLRVAVRPSPSVRLDLARLTHVHRGARFRPAEKRSDGTAPSKTRLVQELVGRALGLRAPLGRAIPVSLNVLEEPGGAPSAGHGPRPTKSHANLECTRHVFFITCDVAEDHCGLLARGSESSHELQQLTERDRKGAVIFDGSPSPQKGVPRLQPCWYRPMFASV